MSLVLRNYFLLIYKYDQFFQPCEVKRKVKQKVGKEREAKKEHTCLENKWRGFWKNPSRMQLNVYSL